MDASSSSSSASSSDDDIEVMYTLVDKSNTNNNNDQAAADYDAASAATTGAASLRVDFGAQNLSLTTGDTVLAPITLQLPASLAEQLGGMLATTATGDVESLAAAIGRRLLLSKGSAETAREEEATTRPEDRGEWHNTRRSVQEFVAVRDVLDALRITNPGQPVKSGAPKLVAKGAEKDLFIVNGKPQQVSSLTFVFRSSPCGLIPALDAARVRQQWFDTNSGADLETYHS
ncbi:hypothetical protein PLESTF_001695100, partial [Pleodorina starrii]